MSTSESEAEHATSAEGSAATASEVLLQLHPDEVDQLGSGVLRRTLQDLSRRAEIGSEITAGHRNHGSHLNSQDGEIEEEPQEAEEVME